MTLDKLKKEKTTKLLALEFAKQSGDNREVFHLGSEVAALEGIIARAYISKGEPQNAVINLISQASCLCDSRRYSEAVKAFRRALSISTTSDTTTWIKGEISRIPQVQLRENPFQSLVPNIEKNERLRIPQKEAYYAAKRYFKSHSGHAIIQLPVGCGKTGAMSLLPFAISTGRVLAIAPNLEIRRNLHDNFDYNSEGNFLRKFGVLSNGFGPTCSYLDSEANIHDCDAADIVVTNIQQLASRSSKKWLVMLSPDFFDMILIDEAHHNVAQT